jgi:phosphoribosylformimino-5-aminoimidazole carboxamide ribotide isomerase
MDLILAVDLIGGAVVHGQAGKRSEYAPLDWGLSPTAEPVAYVRNLRPKYLYIADIDRIEGKGNHDGTVKRIAPLVSRCYVDRGCRSPSDYLVVPNVINVVGTETAHYSLFLYKGGFLSIDIKNGKTIPLGENPVHVLKAADSLGFEGCIVLNLSAVGTEQGIGEEFLGRMREVYGKTLLYGGGVAGERDLARLAKAGYDGAIVATAVHKGAIPIEWIRRGTWS